MKILSISARNFRTLEDITIPFSKNYCTISGRNNAGKSGIIRLLLILFGRGTGTFYYPDDYTFEYNEDKTQWHESDDPIKVTYVLELNRNDDPALLAFIEKITGSPIAQDPSTIHIQHTTSIANDIEVSVTVNDSRADLQTSLHIVKKLNGSNLMFLHNSATRHEEIYFRRGRRRQFYELILSADEKKQLDEATRQTDRRVKRLAKQHRADLNDILGRLSEKYDVEFSPLEGFGTRHTPLGIKLRDKAVEVPLNDWGSGTQNRTHVLMAVLQANRIKTTASPQDKITPLVVVEEPESFLHPSAQSEFGKVLRMLSTDLGIQILATTHSPYMLNQEDPSANILLSRPQRHGKPIHTTRIDTSADNWMAPFAEHLGIDPSEFPNWRPLFSSYKSQVLLVEGDTDKRYFQFMQSNDLGIERLSSGIEVVPYGGKDTLKNTLLVKFVLSKFDRVYITFDLDAKQDVQRYLCRLGLKDGRDYMALGRRKPGLEALEGLLPERILANVNGRETELVMQLGSQNSKERRTARDKLKQKYLEEFRRQNKYESEELRYLEKAVKTVNRAFATANKRVKRTG